MKEIQQKMQKQLKEMSKGTLFQVNIDRDKVFQNLSGFILRRKSSIL
jgi:hypothetical protein